MKQSRDERATKRPVAAARYPNLVFHPILSLALVVVVTLCPSRATFAAATATTSKLSTTSTSSTTSTTSTSSAVAANSMSLAPRTASSGVGVRPYYLGDYPGGYLAAEVVRPILTPTTELGGLPVVYAGAGDGSWPDQMEPNDSPDEELGPAPVEVGTLYRSLNLLPRTQPVPNPIPGEDRDWYIWSATHARCYRAFTGDIAGSAGQLTGKGRVQHAIRIWWYTAVKEGRKLLSEYNPSMGPAQGGYFAAARACAGVDGLMAAEVFNYGYPLKAPRGATYTFGVLDAGTPGDPEGARLPPSQGNAGLAGSGTAPGAAPVEGNGPGLSALSPPSTRPLQPAPAPTRPPSATPATLIAPTATHAPTASPSPSPSRTPSPSPQPGSDGLPASADVVAYLDQNQNGAPDPGEGLKGLRVALLSVRTNSLQETASTDQNGHARLDWTWEGRVRVSLPDLNWSDLVGPFNMASASRQPSDVWSVAQDGGLYLEVRVLAAGLPAVIP